MKSCGYCGQENHDGATCCTQCGSSEWKDLTPLPATASEVKLKTMAPENVMRTSGSMTTIQCRTLAEAALVAGQLEGADILPLLDEESSEKCAENSPGDCLVEVRVSTKALEADQELSESLGFRAATESARQPLPLALKIIALCLPGIFILGLLVYLVRADSFRRHGFARKRREWNRWFAFGVIAWTAAVLVLLALAK